MEYSLWGEVQNSISLVRGMRLISTPGHGGIVISKKFAEKNLSTAALKRGTIYGNYYSYEEDCDYAIALFEIKKAWDNFFTEYCSEEERERSLLKSLSMWNADYLLEIGIEPLEKEYAFYKDNKLMNEMREAKHPDLIISAHRTDIPGILKVRTANGKAYQGRQSERYEDSNIKLLSNMIDVKEIA